MRQYWKIKSEHFDSVIFFKVGKFYELYHMDATVGVQELGFTYMKGDWAHSGFPETAYDRMATNLVERGYKVVRVEQTETPDMMAIRCKRDNTNSKYDKIVNREVCQVTVKGTQVYGQQSQMTLDYKNNYLLTISEKV
jgi:DNA mismatch repair protein MSH6